MQRVIEVLVLSGTLVAVARLCSIAAFFGFLYFQYKNGNIDFD